MTAKKIYGPEIKWNGGECPVPPDTFVEVKLRKGAVTGPSTASSYEWDHDDDGGDIVEYRTVIEQPDLDAAEKLLRNYGYTVIPPAKPLMTATEINALPHKAREYIHQLEANTDPAGMVRENMQLLDTNKGLQIMYRNRTDELGLARNELATYRALVTYMLGKGWFEEPLTEAPPRAHADPTHLDD